MKNLNHIEDHQVDLEELEEEALAMIQEAKAEDLDDFNFHKLLFTISII